MTLSEAVENANRLALSLHGLQLKNDLRSRAAAACFAVAQQHHNAILVLLSNHSPLNATAFALLRLLNEATIRGHWLSHCATDAQVSNFVNPERQQLDTASMIAAICKVATLAGGKSSLYASAYQNLYKMPSAYTHTGDLQVQRWLTTKDIEPHYSVAEITELLRLANDMAELAVVGAKALIKDNLEQA